MILVLSSILAHYSTAASRLTFLNRLAAQLSIFLRRCGKIMAALNTVLIVVAGVFQFTNFFDRCYCNSSVLGWGSRAFYVMELNQGDIDHTKRAWIGGVVLAAGSVTLFAGFITLFINPTPPSTPHST